MKLLLVQDHLRSGGAARAAARWADLLRKSGHEVTQAAGDEEGSGAVLVSGKAPRGLGRLRELIFGKRSCRTARVRNAFRSLLQCDSWDLVWFHNLAGGEKWGWSTEMIGTARQHAPVLWTMHDMWALGDGGEAYWQEDLLAEGGKWKGAERSGPKAKEGEGEKVAGIEKSRLRRVCGEAGNYPVGPTAPSRWLAQLTREMTGQECAFLANPIDLKVFSPGDRKAARRRFGLPEEGWVVLAGADSWQDRRKGFDLLREAWNRRPAGATLALFGKEGEKRTGTHVLGNLDADRDLVAAYRAADLYVHPARQENAPCTIQESLACGTPVLAFAVGGIPEMIQPGTTGFLAPQVTGSALSEALAGTLSPDGRLARMREACRNYAEDFWKPETLVRAWEEVLRKRSPAG